MFVASVNIVHPLWACCDVTRGTNSAKTAMCSFSASSEGVTADTGFKAKQHLGFSPTNVFFFFRGRTLTRACYCKSIEFGFPALVFVLFKKRVMPLIQFTVVSVPVQRQLKLKTLETMLPFYLSLTMHGWITPRNHELFNFHLEKLSSRSSYYERICSNGYNSHLNGSLHLLEGIRAEAFNKRLNLSDK